MLQLKNIYKSYITGQSRQIALDGINLRFRRSEFVVIKGASGSGKTTFLNIIAGLEYSDKGDLIFNGKSTKEFTDEDWNYYRNNYVGFIFKDSNLIPHLSILENVEIAVSMTNLSKDEIRKKSIDAIEKVGLKDYITKTSEDLSKEEVKRVEIARAIVNDPDIIIADNPTGNLDSNSTLEIIKLIKEVFRNKLVIMATQNSIVSKEYATRIIQFRYGEVIYDSDPLYENSYQREFSIGKTKINLFTCMKFNLRFISKKKLKTFLTILISSIGVSAIGITLSLINGFNEKINSYENDTLSGFPIVINEIYTGLDINNNYNNKSYQKYSNDEIIYPYDSETNSQTYENKITCEYMDYIKNMDKNLFSTIFYNNELNMNILKKDENGKVSIVDTSKTKFSSYPSGENETYLQDNYDLLYGYYPASKRDAVLIVDDYNRVDKNILKNLGIESKGKIEFDELIGKEFKIILNDDFYKKNKDYYFTDNSDSNLNRLYNLESSITIDITGIIRAKKENSNCVLPQGITFSNDLYKDYINNCMNSDIVKSQKNLEYNVITGQSFEKNENKLSISDISDINIFTTTSSYNSKEDIMSFLGASYIPSSITIYPKDFEAKGKIIKYLNKYNEKKDKEDMVVYTDKSEVISKKATTIMIFINNIIEIVISILIIVSVIIIFITTYISLLERQKEISILKMLGARKRDIFNLFNLENIFIGICFGILGIFTTCIFIIPINLILKSITGCSSILFLKFKHIILLMMISIFISLIGGIIPAKMAANKNPIKFLKNE